ncbi:MAG TPA: diguanylate cyclase [Pseudoxanthomonas sp.]|nr:diguanylate cyclase [Pseudoxanthomonas sp.]
MPHRLTLPKSYWADRAVLALLIGLSAWLALTLARGPAELAGVWASNGILAGWLLSRPTASWPGYVAVGLAAELLARMLAGDAPAHGLAIAASNLVEVLLLAGTVRRLVPDTLDPRSWMRLGAIATAATLVACLASGLLAAAVLHYQHGAPFLPALARWFAAHVVGMVVAATTTLVAHREGLGLFIAPRRRWSLAGILLLLAAVTAAAFLTRYPLLFLAYPPLLLAAVRQRFAGAGLGVIAMALVATAATALGHGPLWQPGMGDDDRVALLQLFIAGGCLMTIPVCLAMAERDRLAARLHESESRYRMLADHSHDAILRIRADGECVYASPAATEMLGWSAGELLGSHWELLHPDDRDRQRQALARALASGQPSTDLYRLRHKDGRHVWIEAVSRVIPAAEDGEPGLIVIARNVDQRIATEQALEASRRELERQTRVDALTDLANRRQFDERLQLALRRLQRHGVPLALLTLDVDRFKRINDSHGHAAGDAVLQAFAARLRASVRETDLVARLGGDEFAILLEDLTPGAAEAVARKVIEAMAEPVETAGTRIPVSTSIGIARAERPTDAATLLASADAALYAAKRAGRNGYRVAGGD